jgi:ATP-dependent helicase Lhr and Lhr-like helicase
VWAGLITNDTFAPLRALAGGARSHRRGREPALAGGRWSLVSDLGTGPDRGHTGRLLARAWTLLERYGVVSREAVQAEGLPGGFSPLYRVLKEMEQSGRVRRGYFVEGLSGAQFALPGALDRLRAARLDEVPVDGFGPEAVRLLAALDPANPYGALLPWPEHGGGAAPRRVGGAWVILVAGKPVLYLGPGGRSLTSFPASLGDCRELALALDALRTLSGHGRKRLLIRQIDGLPALGSPLRGALLAAGFESDYDALSPSWGVATRAGIGRDPNAVACAGPVRSKGIA